jgi:hypothetical protein
VSNFREGKPLILEILPEAVVDLTPVGLDGIYEYTKKSARILEAEMRQFRSVIIVAVS